MFKKISLILLIFILGIAQVFAAESFSLGDFSYTIDLVYNESTNSSDLVITVVDSTSADPEAQPPETISAEDIYEQMGYADSSKTPTAISKALADLGDTQLAVTNPAAQSKPETKPSAGGYTNEDGLFIPEDPTESIVESIFSPEPANPDKNEINVILRGVNDFTDTTVSFPDQKPVIVDGRTLVPARGVFEELGYQVDWDSETSSAIVAGNDVTIRIPLGSTTLYKNDKEVTIDVPAQMINSRTMIPLRAISRALNLQVEWDSASKSAIVYYQ